MVKSVLKLIHLSKNGNHTLTKAHRVAQMSKHFFGNSLMAVTISSLNDIIHPKSFHRISLKFFTDSASFDREYSLSKFGTETDDKIE